MKIAFRLPLWNCGPVKFMSIYFKSIIFYHPLIQVIQREPWEHIKDDDIKKTAESFCGEIWQVPPMFSAIKVRFLALLSCEFVQTG